MSRYVTLYRGLHGVGIDQVSASQVGPHWTTDPTIAYYFATGRDVEGNVYWDDEITLAGTIVEARVHRRHVIDLDSEEGQEWVHGENVFGPNHVEQERTVRLGSIVIVTGLTYVDDDADTFCKVSPSPRGWRA